MPPAFLTASSFAKGISLYHKKLFQKVIMKHFMRLCALFCTLALLLGAVACTKTPVTPQPGDRDTVNDTAGETDGGTASGASTARETDAPTSPVTEAPSETDAETGPAPETPGHIPAGYIQLLDPEGIDNIGAMRLLVKTATDEAAGFDYATLTPRNADPWLVLADQPQNAVEGARFMRIMYRTTAPISGRLFLGETQINEAGSLPVSYITDGEWHVLALDLYASDAYSPSLGALRYDPMDGADRKTEYLDIAWIGFYPPSDDPLADLPALPEDSPNLEDYETLPDGSAHYIASGQLSGEKGTYTFKEGFRLDIYRRGYFNRYTLGYSSTSPIRGEMTYRLWDANGRATTRTEVFFLEAGENQTFSSLIDGYFGHTYAWGVDSITMQTCDHSTATFTLHSLTDDPVEVYSGTYYLENDHYKLGILLSWGGGISYIEDKLDGDDALGNLINRHDTGRLVQQSYYGVKNGPDYTAGYYGETLWQYNPVQGGDLYGNASKLVDVRVGDDGKSLYIKCRPMDWAKNGELTPSYMENTYTVTDAGIRVGNRFVDFFGVKHPAHHFELPAFYTVSYLGTFHYYNGTKPWTGDKYETLPNEPFWAGNSGAYHNIKKGNTETWAAWTNEKGYGIGLYVPGAEIMLAGRHEYNGSKDPNNGGTSYVAPLRTMTIVSFEPFEYEYIIAAGSIDDMRATFQNYAEENGHT